jgi:hypothetical protein
MRGEKSEEKGGHSVFKFGPNAEFASKRTIRICDKTYTL